VPIPGYGVYIYEHESNLYSTTTFEKIVKEYNISKIDFLKFDCEGGEYSIFTKENYEFIPTTSDFNSIVENIFPSGNNFYSFKKDKDIVDKYGLNFYYFLKYTILSNNINLIPSKLINDKNTFLEKDPSNIYEENIQFDITYSPDIENKFKTPQIHYLFHGSGSSNWYGMLRNGIKNFSNTKLMTNGAVYGPGIYLSDSLTFAKGYSSKYYSNNTNELLIVGVCQVKQEINAYKKAPNIYVVADDSELLLRHIIIMNKTNKIQEIEKYYRVDVPSQYSLSNKNIFKVSNKRLTKEIEFLEKFRKKLDKSIFEDFIIDSKLEPVLQLNIKLILITKQIVDINIILRDFPNNPPIISLDNIIIKNKNFFNNNIYIDNDIIPKNWTITNKLVDFIDKITKIIESNEIEVINQNNQISDIIMKYDNYIKTNNLFVC
jgi:hypothetical protein